MAKHGRGRPRLELGGWRFGHLVVVEFFGLDARQKNTVWSCLCDCGRKINLPARNLRSGNTKSCGCRQREGLKQFRAARQTKSAANRQPPV